ncbi:MAG: hypothetical protein LBH84_09530, partial [Prevotellaceae bacterium]|nr:hypothetical protein [Prevotellaceae bacterium]
MKNIIFPLLLVVTTAIAANAAIYVKVDASGTGNGSCWNDAFTDIGSAIAAASDDEDIYVAGGIYEITASLPQKAVKIYGGFVGNEATPNPAQRAKGGSGRPWDFATPTVVDASRWAESADRIFAYRDGAVALTLDGLTFQGRKTSDHAPVIKGNAGLVMQNCIV